MKEETALEVLEKLATYQEAVKRATRLKSGIEKYPELSLKPAYLDLWETCLQEFKPNHLFIRVTPKLHKRLKGQCVRAGREFSNYLTVAIIMGLVDGLTIDECRAIEAELGFRTSLVRYRATEALLKKVRSAAKSCGVTHNEWILAALMKRLGMEGKA